ncbi:hypothetical protein ScPMuIL_005981 [Solemya velum]
MTSIQTKNGLLCKSQQRYVSETDRDILKEGRTRMWNKIGILFTVCFVVDPILCQRRYCYYLLGEVQARLCFDCPAGFHKYKNQCYFCNLDQCNTTQYKEFSDSDTVSRTKFCDSPSPVCLFVEIWHLRPSPSPTCYGCQKGYYGYKTCHLQCDDRCDSHGCDYNSGNCFRCDDGYWGDTCSSSCPVGCSGSRCDQVAGGCDVCQEGLTGYRCLTPCAMGYTGDTCSDAIDQGVDEGLIGGVAIGGLFGGFLLTAVVAVILVYFLRRSQKQDLRDRHHLKQTAEITPQPQERVEPLPSPAIYEIPPGPMSPIYERLRLPDIDTDSEYQSLNKISRGTQTDDNANSVIDDTSHIYKCENMTMTVPDAVP